MKHTEHHNLKIISFERQQLFVNVVMYCLVTLHIGMVFVACSIFGGLVIKTTVWFVVGGTLLFLLSSFLWMGLQRDGKDIYRRVAQEIVFRVLYFLKSSSYVHTDIGGGRLIEKTERFFEQQHRYVDKEKIQSYWTTRIGAREENVVLWGDFYDLWRHRYQYLTSPQNMAPETTEATSIFKELL